MRRPLAALAAAICVVTLGRPAFADRQPASPDELKARVTERDALPGGSAGNGIYRVYMEKNYGLGVGGYTVLTGPDHPAGAGKDVLYGNGVPGTSFLSIRDLTTQQDFLASWYLTQSNEHSLDNHDATVAAIGTAGFRASWYLGSDGGNASVTQDVNVLGTTLADSSVEVTTKITSSAHTYQVQYLWDIAVGADDGPALQTAHYRPFTPSETHETTVSSVNILSTVDDNSAVPTLATGMRGSASAKFVCWPRAVGAPFGSYQTDPTVDISTPASGCTGPSGPDSAVVLQFPQNTPNTEYKASASLLTSPVVRYPTSIAVEAPRPLSSPSLNATMTDTGHGVPGQTLTFSTPNGSVLCTATTGQNGAAGCGGTTEALAASRGYKVTYPGGAIWAPATGQR